MSESETVGKIKEPQIELVQPETNQQVEQQDIKPHIEIDVKQNQAPENINKVSVETKPKSDDNCFLKVFFTTGEILFYPFLALILSLLLNIFGAVVCIILGALGFILLAFIPFACICCCCGDNGKETATIYTTFTFVLIIVFFSGIFSLVFLPFVIIYDFIMTYVKIFKQEISWKNPLEQNLGNLVNHSKRLVSKTYNMTREKMRAK